MRQLRRCYRKGGYGLSEIYNGTEEISIFDGRIGEDRKWELPRYGHPLARGVFPLRAKPTGNASKVGERHGTAFCVGKLGAVMSAMHCFNEALRHSGDSRLQSRKIDEWPKSSALTDVELSVDWHELKEDKSGVTVKTVPLTHLAAPTPTDLVMGSMLFIEKLPLLKLQMTFHPPRVGSKVVCVGYSAASNDDGGHELFNYTFSAVEGTVVAIFPQGLGSSVLDAACFLIDVEPPPGMSGGPVFDEHGNVCGIVSMGATHYMHKDHAGFPSEAGVVSLLHPVLPTELEAKASFGLFNITAKKTVWEWITLGAIRTDGSEGKCRVNRTNGELEVGCAYNRDLHTAMYLGLQDFLDGKPYNPPPDDSPERG